MNPQVTFVAPAKKTRVFYVAIGENNSVNTARAKKIVEEFRRSCKASDEHYENFFFATPTNSSHIQVFY